LLSNLPRKSVEPVALAAGGTVRALQMFITDRVWDRARLRDRLQQRVATQHVPAPGTPWAADALGAIGLIDETSAAKKGDKTPGVQRQYCGAGGKIDNCIVTVHLGYHQGDFKTLLDSDLYLPRNWAEDRQRCRAADIPADLAYRPKTAIALEQVRHALGMILCQLVLLFLAEQTGRIDADIVAAATRPADTPRGEKTTRTDLGSTEGRYARRPTADHHSGSSARHDGADRGLPELVVCPMA
jgi:hypothetical protein